MTTTEQNNGTGPHRVLEAALDYAEAVKQYSTSDGPSDAAQALLQASLDTTRAALLAASDPDLRERFERVNATLVEQTENCQRLATEVIDKQRLNVDMHTRNDRLAAERDAAQRELSSFKEQVVEVATRYTEEHGWCSVIDEGLRELGLERKPTAYTARLVITVDVAATLSGRRDIPSDSWVRDSIIGKGEIAQAIRDGLGFDGDHAGGRVTNIDFEVIDVEEDND